MSYFLFPPLQTTLNAAPMEFVRDGADTQVSEDTGTPANSRPLPTKLLDENGNPIDIAQLLEPVDYLEAGLGEIINPNTNPIPASASNPLEVVTSSAAIIRKIRIKEDIGEFIGVYTGPNGGLTFIGISEPGGGVIDCNIAAGTRVSIRNMRNAALNDTNTRLAIDFLG